MQPVVKFRHLHLSSHVMARDPASLLRGFAGLKRPGAALAKPGCWPPKWFIPGATLRHSHISTRFSLFPPPPCGEAGEPCSLTNISTPREPSGGRCRILDPSRSATSSPHPKSRLRSSSEAVAQGRRDFARTLALLAPTRGRRTVRRLRRCVNLVGRYLGGPDFAYRETGP